MDINDTIFNGRNDLHLEQSINDDANLTISKSCQTRVVLEEGSELNFKEVPESGELIQKGREIEDYVNGGDVTVERLREYALSEGGFVNDYLRQRCWPLLIGVPLTGGEPLSSEESLRSHPEYSQVVLDVNRSLKRFPPGVPYSKRVALQGQLTNLILRVITKYPHLRYYQGYHDVAITFLLVVGEDLAFRIMEKLSTHHLRDCMEPTMEKTSHLLNYVYPLVNRVNPRLCTFLDKSGAGTMFCLPWFLTWFGHSLNHYKDVVRLYDFFLASPPLMSLYLTAAIVTYRHEDIFSTECDMASVHCLLSQLPDELPFERLIADAVDLYDSFPPENVEIEVRERARKEKEERERAEEEIRRKVNERKKAVTRLNVRAHLERLVPRSKTQLVLLAFSIAMGLYAYLRGEGAGDFPIR
ncbi:TBC1 domain family member 20 [Rhodnius prolixus]